MKDEETVKCSKTIREEGGERKLVINCRECEDDFSYKKCLPKLILTMEGEVNIDSIILSDYIERQYSEENMEVLMKIKDMVSELNRLSNRRKTAKKCRGCEINPSKIYPRLKRVFIKDPGSVYAEFTDVSRAVMKADGCTSCRRSTKEELTVLGEDLIKLRSKVLSDAFGIVG